MSGVLNYQQVSELTGLHRSSIWRAARDGRFPAPVRLQGRRVGFIEAEVRDWIAARTRVDYNGRGKAA